MNRNTVHICGIGVTFFGIGFETILRLSPRVQEYFPGPFADLLGLGLTILGLVIITLGMFIPVYRFSVRVSKKISPALMDRLEYSFDSTTCQENEIPEVWNLGRSMLFDLTHIELHSLMERYRINSHIIKCIKKKKPVGNNLTGYYIMYPITKTCEDLLRKGLVTSGKQIQGEHICKRFNHASALYISLVYGIERHSKAFLSYIIERDLNKIMNHNRRIRTVYTRPCSDDGFRMAKQFGFRKLVDNPQIHSLGVYSDVHIESKLPTSG